MPFLCRFPLRLCATLPSPSISSTTPFTTTTPRRSTTTPADHNPMARLAEAAEVEIQKEVARDADGVGSIPPLVPPGWRMEHTPRSRYLTITRLPTFDASPPRFPTTTHYQRRSTTMNRSSSSSNSSGNSMSVKIVVPFATLDPSLHDNAIDACEWQPFDVFCQKKTRENNNSSSTRDVSSSLYSGSAAASPVLHLRLAAVNSQLRVRFIQWLKADTLAQAIADSTSSLSSATSSSRASTTPRGNPTTNTAMTTSPSFNASPPPSTTTTTTTTASSFSPSPSRRLLRDATAMVSATSNSSHAATTTGVLPEYCRTLLYHGPDFTSLSSELQSRWLDYITRDIGIDPLMMEYILQSCYFAEIEEYQRWLMDMAVFAQDRS